MNKGGANLSLNRTILLIGDHVAAVLHLNHVCLGGIGDKGGIPRRLCGQEDPEVAAAVIVTPAGIGLLLVTGVEEGIFFLDLLRGHLPVVAIIGVEVPEVDREISAPVTCSKGGVRVLDGAVGVNGEGHTDPVGIVTQHILKEEIRSVDQTVIQIGEAVHRIETCGYSAGVGVHFGPLSLHHPGHNGRVCQVTAAVGLVAPHLHMLNDRCFQRCAAALFFTHFVHRGDLPEQPLDRTVLTLVAGIAVDSKPFHGLLIALPVIHKQGCGHDADVGVQVLVHEPVGAVLEHLHLRAEKVGDKLFRVLIRPGQLRVCIALCDLIGRIPEDLRRDADTVCGDTGVDTGVVEVRQRLRVNVLIGSDDLHRVPAVGVVASDKVHHRLCVGPSTVIGIGKLAVVKSAAVPFGPQVLAGKIGVQQHGLKIGFPRLTAGPKLGLEIFQDLPRHTHAGVGKAAEGVGVRNDLRQVVRTHGLDPGIGSFLSSGNLNVI